MTYNIQSTSATGLPTVSHKAIFVLTLMLAGRAMTIAFLWRVGGTGQGDPPDAWLMPLLGDVVIGVSALAVAFLIWRRPGPWAWVTVIVWNAIGAWDAISAYLVNLAEPWPEFFMLELIGEPMFFAAALMHVVLLVIAARPPMRESFGIGAKLA